jgi:hypothetical protein
MACGCDAAKARLWRERFERFEDGGLTIAEFCGAEGTSTASFYAWRRKLATQRQTTQGRSPQRKKKRQKKRPREKVAGRGVFEPLTIAAAAVVIRLPGGISIEVPAHSEHALRAIVGQLMRADVEVAPC